MTVIIAAIVGFLMGRVLWVGLRHSWQGQPLMRDNYQGVSLPTAAGVVLTFALLTVEATRAIFAAADVGADPGLTAPRAATLIVVVGFTVIGLIDDLVGSTQVRGLAGHLKALRRGELTSGAIKMIAGAATALIAVSVLRSDSLGTLLVSAAVVALCANLFNLLDTKPGRTTKVSVVTFAVLALIAGFDTALVPVAVVIGAATTLMFEDLRERLMIGDTGANVIGAAIGVGIITQVGSTGRLVALAVLLGLNLLSEFVSFSKLIDAVGPLRAFDGLGRRSPTTLDLRDREGEPSSDAPFRHMASPIRATVGGAHEGSSAGAPRPAGQSFETTTSSGERPTGPTRPFSIPHDEDPSPDLFGYQNPDGRS